MAPQLRVFQLINALRYGGAENMLIDLVSNISDIDFTVGYMEAENDLVPELVDTGADVKSFNEGFRFDPRAFNRLRQFLASESFDIVHFHLPYAQTVGRIAAVGTEVDGIVSTQHNVVENYHPVTRVTERSTRFLDNTTVAVSNGVEQSFTGTSHQPNKLDGDWCTIYNGIDVTEFSQRVEAAEISELQQKLDLNSSTWTFLNVGRYVPVKRQKEAIKIVAEADFEANLLVVGDGPLKEDLRSLATQLDVTDQVHVTGRVPDVEPYYAVSDLFLAPSRGEGLPITLLEAMAAELPVVATDIPGIQEVVDNGVTGELYQPGDLDDALTKIKKIQTPSVRQSYAHAAQQRVQSVFSIKQMAKSYEKLYRDIVKN